MHETSFSSGKKPWNWFCCNVGGQFHFFAYGEPNDPALFEKTIIFPSVFVPRTLFKSICLFAYSYANTVCRNHYSFIIKSCYPVELSLTIIFFFKIVLVFLILCNFHTYFGISLPFSTQFHTQLLGATLRTSSHVLAYVISTFSPLSNGEHKDGVSLHLGPWVDSMSQRAPTPIHYEHVAQARNKPSLLKILWPWGRRRG